MLNWAPICDIKVSPMVDDAMSRANLQDKPYFQAKASGEEGASDSA